MKSFLLFLFCFLLTMGWGWAQPAGTMLPVGGTFTTNISALSRGPDPSKAYQRVIAVYPPADLQGVGAGSNLLSLGFRLRTPATAAVSGTLRVWLCNTTHTSYLLTPDWAYSLQNPVPFQQVYNGPLTIPATAGWFDVTFQTPFAFAGGGFYLAYEWETPNPIAASGSYECDERIAQALRAGTSQLSFPAQVTTVSAYRPQLRVVYRTPGRDAAVLRVYGPGKMPLQACAAPYPVQAVVANAGSQTLTNLPVTFTSPAGASVTVTVPSLAPGAETTVQVPGLAPTGPAGSYVSYRVSVPATDQNPANDSRGDSSLVTARELTYVTGYPTAAFGVSGAGFGTGLGSGTLLCRYQLQAPVLVRSVRVRLWNQGNNPNNTVFAVVLDEQGRLLARSADYVLPLSAGNVSSWQTFALPQPTRVAGRAFFVGLAQTAPATAGRYYYPVACQAEAPARDSAYYVVAGDSALTGLKPPREVPSLGRFMVEAELESAPLAVRPAFAPVATVDVWPNPAAAGAAVTLRLNVALTGPAVVLDMAGREVWRGPLPASKNRRDEYALPALRPGLYFLHFPTAAQPISRRLVVE